MDNGDPQIEGIMSEISKNFSELGLGVTSENEKKLEELTREIQETEDRTLRTEAISRFQEIVEAICDESSKVMEIQEIKEMALSAETFLNNNEFARAVHAFLDAIDAHHDWENRDNRGMEMQVRAIVTNAKTYFDIREYDLCIDALMDAVEYADNINLSELANKIYNLKDTVKSIMPK